MPDRSCPRCRRTGFIRSEHVIKGANEIRSYYCGACDFSWDVAAHPRRQSKGDIPAMRDNPPPDRSRS